MASAVSTSRSVDEEARHHRLGDEVRDRSELEHARGEEHD
jgi:hypothetical protein